MVFYRRRTSTFAVLGTALALFVLLLAGCDKRAVPTGTVSGQVTHHGGKPLKDAEISFIAPQLGSGASAQLDADGRYAVNTPLKAGSYQVMVAPPATPYKPGDAPATKPAEIENPDIPAKVRDWATSGLIAEIKEGKNENVNFDLQD